VYASSSSDGDQQIVETVLSAPRTVAGVRATVVHDVVRDEDGKVVEDTYDWYAQDTSGNVWYLGEDTTAYEDRTANTEGSWETGVHGARAGIIMLARPTVGAAYQQEWLKGVAEDRGKVLALDASVTVPAGTYTAVIQTEDTTALEPDLVENKWYARGIGVVQERDVHGGDERVVLLSKTP
jgi:hypothetical protein